MNASLSAWLTDLPAKASEALPAIIAGVVVATGFVALATVVRAGCRRWGIRLGVERQPLLNLAGQTVWFVLSTIGVVSGLGTMGVDVSALIASLGLTGFAVGFALRDALSNLLAGMLIMLYRPFYVGDTISVTGLTGRVRSVDFRYTVLDGDGKTMLVPNAILFSNTVTVEQRS